MWIPSVQNWPVGHTKGGPFVRITPGVIRGPPKSKTSVRVRVGKSIFQMRPDALSVVYRTFPTPTTYSKVPSVYESIAGYEKLETCSVFKSIVWMVSCPPVV